MSNPTSNYSFQMPTSSDLVTDLPADFEVFGQAVDTRLKALQPNTTLGDLAYGSATANTNTRLGIGSTGQVLTVAGGVPSWATIAAGSMTLLSTTTLSGASTTISSISGSYNNLQILIYGVTNNTAAGVLSLTFNSLGSNNNYTITQFNNGGTLSTRNASNDAVYFASLVDNWNRTSTSNFVSLTVDNYASSATNKSLAYSGYYVGASFNEGFVGGGALASTAAITQIVLSNSGGTFSAGTCLIYGVK